MVKIKREKYTGWEMYIVRKIQIEKFTEREI